MSSEWTRFTVLRNFLRQVPALKLPDDLIVRLSADCLERDGSKGDLRHFVELLPPGRLIDPLDGLRAIVTVGRGWTGPLPKANSSINDPEHWRNRVEEAFSQAASVNGEISAP
jgi:hypothetical protein